MGVYGLSAFKRHKEIPRLPGDFFMPETVRRPADSQDRHLLFL